MKATDGTRLDVWRLLSAPLGLLLLFLQGCDGQAAKHHPPQRHQIPAFVTIGEVTEETIPIVMDFSGTVQAVMKVEIIPRVTGYIDKRYFIEGTFVKEGAPLYLIDPRPFQEKLKELEAQLEGYKANRTFAEAEVKRYTKAGATGAVSQEQIDEAVAKVEEARASVDETNAEIAEAKLNLGYTNIKAPFAGRIQNTLIDVGNLVSKETDVLTDLVQLDPVYVVFGLSRRQLYEIQKLQLEGLVPKGREKLRVEVVLPDGSVYPHQGHVDFISAEIDSSTDTLMVRGVLPNPFDEVHGIHLVPGQYTAVRLIVGERSGALLVPEKAVVQTQAGRHVFVVDKENKAAIRTVEVSSTSYKGQWVVEKGLKKGERVVVDGVPKVRPGVVVKPTPPAAKKAEPKPEKKA